MCARNTAAKRQNDDLHRRVRKDKARQRKREREKKKCEPKKQTKEAIVNEKFFFFLN